MVKKDSAMLPESEYCHYIIQNRKYSCKIIPNTNRFSLFLTKPEDFP